LVSADNLLARSHNLLTQALAFCFSNANDAKKGIQCGLQAVSFAQGAGQPALNSNVIGVAAICMITAGQLHEAQRLTQQAMLPGKPGEPMLPEVGYPSSCHAEILREWNELDAALILAEEATSLYKQVQSMASLVYLLCTYTILLRVHLSHANLDAAQSTLQEAQYIGTSLSQPIYAHTCAHFMMVDQIRLWLACGELDRATHWAKNLDMTERYTNPYVREREEVAYARVLLAKHQPDLALKRLEPVLKRAAVGQRWKHVIEGQLLQALAHQMCQQEKRALDILSEALHLGEPEGYIRTFVDEGAQIETLLYQIHKRDSQIGPTPYLDTLLAAFQQEGKTHRQAGESTKPQILPVSLSKRELEVLQLLARGASNQEIAEELVIVIDTAKRHISHIFSKLDVNNRVQAVWQARELGLLD
jgi:LuxR family maltose regulon positive regulatory protein